MLTVVKADPHELADRLYPKLARQIKAVLDAVSASDDLDVLRIPDEIRDAVRDVYAQVAAATAGPASASLGVAFNSVNPAVTAWASTHTGQLITLITDEARDAIREAIVEAARQGLSIDRTARNLRPYLGLNAPQARALARFEASFDTPSPKLVERRAAKLLRERAEMIARTELIQASNMGQQITWTAAADQGLIPRTAFKEWLATSDDRTCPICMNMDGTKVPYNESYTVTTRFDAQGAALATTASVTPPAHPRCRCAMVLVELDGTPVTSRVQFSDEALAELDDEVRAVIADSVERINGSEYGKIVQIREVRTRMTFNNPDLYDEALASVERIDGSDDVFLYVNPRHAKTLTAAGKFSDISPPGTAGPKFVATGPSGYGLTGADAGKRILDVTITHEYGHALQYQMDRVLPSDVLFRRDVNEVFYQNINLPKSGYYEGGWPSLYSSESAVEFFAETFADIVHNGPAASPLSLEVKRIMDAAIAALR